MLKHICIANRSQNTVVNGGNNYSNNNAVILKDNNNNLFYHDSNYARKNIQIQPKELLIRYLS